MLTDRQQLILRAIIDDYVKSAEPVGSRSISKRQDVSFSSATIRNEMADLEELGYLVQPHTSAGRIPSQKGYRFYVDKLMRPSKLTRDEVSKVKHLFAEKFVEFEQVIQHTASILSEITNYTAIVLGPEMFDTTLKNIQLIPLSEQTGVAIIVTSTGHVENRKVDLPPGISLSDIERMINMLNLRLKDVPLFQLKTRLYSEIAQELKEHFDQYQEVITLLDQAFTREKDEKIFLGGTTNIFAQPEFRDVEKVKSLFEFLEQSDRLHGIFANTNPYQGVTVKIGQENTDEAISNCSIITASYTINGKPVGKLSILGPTRMEYQRVYGVLEHLTQDLSKLLKQLL